MGYPLSKIQIFDYAKFRYFLQSRNLFLQLLYILCNKSNIFIYCCFLEYDYCKAPLSSRKWRYINSCIIIIILFCLSLTFFSQSISPKMKQWTNLTFLTRVARKTYPKKLRGKKKKENLGRARHNLRPPRQDLEIYYSKLQRHQKRKSNCD